MKKFMKKMLFILSAGFLPFSVLAEGLGEKIYNQICSSCHEQGVFGAPKLGISSDWTDRISKGSTILNHNAIEGYAGDKGFMPPRGGDPSLSDSEVRGAVQYMIDKSW